MTPNKTASFLVQAIEAKEPILVVGLPGIGKSQVIDKACQLAGADHLIQHCVTHEPIDGRGLPCPDKGGEFAHWLPFEDLQCLITCKKLTVCDFEDFGQSLPQVQASKMQLLLRRQLGNFKLSDFVTFLASTNSRASDGVSGILEPVKARFTIIEMEPCIEDLRQVMAERGMPLWLQAFLAAKPSLMIEDGKGCTKELVNKANPRGWERVGRWDLTGIRDLEVWSGCVGAGAAREAYAFAELADKAPSRDEIIASPDSYPVPENASLRYFIATSLAQTLTKEDFEPSLRFCIRLGKVFETLFILDGHRKHASKIKDSQAWKKWCSDKENFSIISGIDL